MLRTPEGDGPFQPCVFLTMDSAGTGIGIMEGYMELLSESVWKRKQVPAQEFDFTWVGESDGDFSQRCVIWMRLS